MKRENGGPAFPSQVRTYEPDNYEGMTLRDWFAGMALAGMMANPVIEQEMQKLDEKKISDEVQIKAFVGIIFDFADAMLKEREI
jgi:hypothetical protein